MKHGGEEVKAQVDSWATWFLPRQERHGERQNLISAHCVTIELTKETTISRGGG